MTRALRLWAWLLLADLFVRSIDYLSGSQMSDLEDNLTIPEVWGVAGLVTSATVLAGLLLKRSAVLKFGSIMAFAVYMMIAVQRFETSMLPYPWPPENPRWLVGMAVFSLLWLSLAGTVWWREYVAREAEKEALSG